MCIFFRAKKLLQVLTSWHISIITELANLINENTEGDHWNNFSIRISPSKINLESGNALVLLRFWPTRQFNS